MPRIALITTSYIDETPGSEAAGSFVEDFAIELAKSVDVTVLAAGNKDSIESGERLTVRRFAVSRLPLSRLRPGVPSDWLAIVSTLMRGGRATAEMVAADRPDHILALWALPSGWWARSTGVPFSIWALGSDIWTLGRIPLVRSALTRVLRAAEHRFADGIRLGADVEGLSGKNCSLLPSTRRLPPASVTTSRTGDKLRLAFLGRWHPNKGADLLMEALLKLGEDDWKQISEVRICGGGPLAERMRNDAKSLTAACRPVVMGGYLDRDEAADLIAWADYLVLPSRIESIPVVFSDAMQLGTPIIATPVGDLPRLHERYDFGVLADSASCGSLIDALRSAMRRDPASFESGVELARKDFDLTRITAQFLGSIGVSVA
jgi:hypothetical protein